MPISAGEDKKKDGYYTFNAFYTDRGPVSPQSIEDRDYDHDFFGRHL